jgi:photosystem II stability/assembly factor-like uncharacterized protein
MAASSDSSDGWARLRLKTRQQQMTAMAGFLVLLAVATFISYRQPAPPQFEPPHAIGSWRWWLNPVEQNAVLRPPVATADLRSVAFVSPQAGWAVGYDGAILHTADGGQSWQFQRGGPTYPLYSVAFVSQQLGWAVGDGGTILHTVDGGRSWQAQSSGTQQVLRSVAFVSPQVGWAVGSFGIILHTADGGQSWNTQRSGSIGLLSSVAFVSPLVGWAVGYGGTMLHTADGGQNWQPQKSGTPLDLNSVAFVSTQVGWAVGKGGTILHTADGGQSWQAQSSSTQLDLNSAAFLSSLVGWAVGFANGKGDVILRTDDGGVSWSPQQRGPEEGLFSITCVYPQKAWAVGKYGTILHTDNGGQNWQEQTSGAKYWLSSVAFVSAEEGWAVGRGGTILHTVTGGQSWQAQDSGAHHWLKSITFVSPESVWAAGFVGTIFHTTDRGRTWKPQLSGTGVPDLSSVAFASPQSGWVAGYGGEVRHTIDGGQSWEEQSSGTAQGLYFVAVVSPQTGWAVGYGGTIRHTADGGKSWQAQSSGTQQILYSVAFVSPQVGWAVGYGGTILHTADGGQSWQAQSSTTQRDLNSVAFVSPQLGWAVGGDGTILHTTDGGERWQAQSSGTHQDLTSVAFASPQAGWVVGYGSTILHTEDGGKTWKRQGYRRWPAPWFALSLIGCIAGFVWALQPLAPPTTAYIEDLANADSPVAQLKFDALGYRPLVRRLLRFIQNPKTKPPLVLAVQAPWGMGKSSVMAMLQSELKSNRAAVTVWFNAWHHQKEDQLLAYLLEAIQKQVAPSWFSPVGLRFRFNLLRVRIFSSPERFLATVAALVLLAFYKSIATLLMSVPAWSQFFGQHPNLPFAGPVVLGLLIAANLLRTFSSDPQKLLEKSSGSLWRTLRDLFVFPSLQGKTDVRHDFARNLKEVTDALLPQRLVIFLDDLDRCQPEQVVQILEAINFLSSAAPCFIIVGADYRKVETLAGQHFEAIAVQEAENVALNLDNATAAMNQPSAVLARLEFAKNYMRKIVNMRLDLPQPTAKGYVDLIRQVGESGNNLQVFWQRAVVGLLLLGCLASAVAIASGWMELPFGKLKQSDVTIVRPEPTEVASRGQVSQAALGGKEGKAAEKAALEEKPTTAMEEVDRDTVGVTWSHRLTIGIPLLIVLVFLVRLLGRPKEIEEAKDSKPFSEALDEMAPRIQERCVTPREVRRFQNYLRFLAAWDESATRPKVNGLEAELVYLAALGIKSPDVKIRDVPREVKEFFSEQCEMLGLDPDTFRPIEERPSAFRETVDMV